ncbi:hypothetical protein EV192_106239 [Actinocrispum wychmicini]|uniref:Uncharacterized protein n=1 Tax=Actinocrispum wychmicini TaxID=1213861 RepID=A0A4R2JCX8_9PSEU|nr:hypothetical protein EV192_106239 [Actinocrispum wychmicini]
MNHKRPVAVISFFTAVPVVLKLLGQLDWSWWGVLAPL